MLLLEDSGTVVRLSSVAKPKRAVPERREVGRTARCSTPCHEPISRIHRSVGLAWAYNMGRKHNVHHCVPLTGQNLYYLPWDWESYNRCLLPLDGRLAKSTLGGTTVQHLTLWSTTYLNHVSCVLPRLGVVST